MTAAMRRVLVSESEDGIMVAALVFAVLAIVAVCTAAGCCIYCVWQARRDREATRGSVKILRELGVLPPECKEEDGNSRRPAAKNPTGGSTKTGTFSKLRSTLNKRNDFAESSHSHSHANRDDNGSDSAGTFASPVGLHLDAATRVPDL